MAKEFLKKASKAYYEGNPIISDEEFDYLAEQHGFEDVGYDPNSNIKHYVRMYSLQKAYVGDKKFPLDFYNGDVYKTPKLDGAAISLLYVPDGTGEAVLTAALSRGDGKQGKNILGNIKTKVPRTIPHDAVIQINCEVVAPKTASDNPRNYAAGALNLKSVEEFESRILKVVALDARPFNEPEVYTDLLDALSSFGFTTPNSQDFNLSDYPTDGVVYRINNLQDYFAQGFTSKHPKGAFALKTKAQGQWTTLNKVTWNVGRSGVVTPVAHIEPITIDGAVVSKATLHNMLHINTLDLQIGDEVSVIRSGEIIPKIIARRRNNQVTFKE